MHDPGPPPPPPSYAADNRRDNRLFLNNHARNQIIMQFPQM